MTLIDRIPENVLNVFRIAGDLADERHLELYTVGGFVRDLLLNRPNKDVDLMVVGDGVSYAKMLAKKLRISHTVVYAEFGTALIPYGDFVIEVASARQETYQPDSRKPEVVYTDLRGDLSRRDFTVNAMALALNRDHFGEFIDYYNGQADLAARLLKTPLDPETTFSEDPLRMLRAARFAAQLDFTVDPAALNAMQQMRERISIVSQERISDELLKTLGAKKPSLGFYVLHGVGLLALVFPEIATLGGVEERDGQRHKDVFHHTLKVVDNTADLSDNVWLRFAALVHDIGKPETKKFVKGTGWSYHGHDELGRKMLNLIGQRMKLPRRLVAYAKKMTRLHLRPIALANENVSDSAIRRLIVEAGENLQDLMILCRADVTSKDPKRVKRYYGNFDKVMNRILEVYEKDQMRAFQSPLRGDEIMTLLSIRPGPLVGKFKKEIEEAILEGEIPNEYDAARAYFDELLIKYQDEIAALREKS